MAVLPRSVPLDAFSPPAMFVGRARELDLLRAHLASALGGHGRLVLVGGEAGIGKTTLIQAVGAEAVTQGALVLTGHCYDLTATPPYGPWFDLAESYRARHGLPPLPAALAGEAGMREAGGQAAVFAQVRDFFVAAAAALPLVVVLEDLHWSDQASLDLLRVLGRHLAAHPILVVVTYRADEVGRQQPLAGVLPALVRESRAERVELRRLTIADVRRLVAARHRLPPADEARLVGYLQARAEGIPFYLGELLRTLEEEGVLADTGDTWTLGDLSQARVPPLLVQVIEGRLARLGDEVREALAVAAVIGQEVPLDVWGTIAALPEESLLAVIGKAADAHVLDATGDGTRVRFVHALIRAALFEGLLSPQRRVWHRRVGETLAGSPDPDPDAVASQFQRAGDRRAIEWLVKAGNRAELAYAWLTATERFEAAIELLAGDPARAGELSWLRYRVGRLRRFSDPARGIVDLEAAERLAVDLDDPVLAALTRTDLGLQRCYMEDMRRGLAETATGMDALGIILADFARSGATIAALISNTILPDFYDAVLNTVHARSGSLAMWLANAGRYGEARGIAEAYLSQASGTAQPGWGWPSGAGNVQFALGIVAAALGRPEEAQAAFERAAVVHRQFGDHAMVAFDAGRELMEVHVPYRTTDLARRRRLLAEAEPAWARASGALGGEGPPHLTVTGHILETLLLAGTWTDARALLAAAQAAASATLWRFQAGWPFVVGVVAWLAFHQGHVALARTLVRDELADGPATEPGGNHFRQGILLQRLAAQIALDADDLPAAEAWLAAHDRWLAWSGAVLGRADGQLLRARYHRRAGYPNQAREHADRALAAATEPRQPLVLLAAHRLAGEISTETGRFADAERHLAAALALADGCAAPFEQALTLLALAELRAVGAVFAEALALLDEVRAIASPLGAAPTLARAEALAARLTAPTTAAIAYPAGLSAREVEVLRLVGEGLTDQAVADRLSISRRTVGQHLRSVYNKLGVPSRAAATRFAVVHGLV
jgi:DNA-binding CsgD family transcriptional regulator